MGNNQSYADRKGKSGDLGSATVRMEGHPFHMEHKPKAPKSLVPQYSDEDQAPVLGKILKPSENKDPTEQNVTRHIPLLNEPSQKRLPVVIKWPGQCKDVKVAGDFNGWKPMPMVKSEKDFTCIVDLPEGTHEYKFLVDGEWKVNSSETHKMNTVGTENNVVIVKDTDFEELENALLKDPNDRKEGPYAGTGLGTLKLMEEEEDVYGQIIPETSPSESKRGPPVLPPHLLQVILNKDTPVSCEPTLLPEPNHVMLNHMYALSIRDGTMVLSTSHRFRKKCVTTLIYRPIAN